MTSFPESPIFKFRSQQAPIGAHLSWGQNSTTTRPLYYSSRKSTWQSVIACRAVFLEEVLFVVAVNDWGAGTSWRGWWPRGGRYVLLGHFSYSAITNLPICVTNGNCFMTWHLVTRSGNQIIDPSFSNFLFSNNWSFNSS